MAKRSATGTKTDTPLIETPQSISVVTKEELRARDTTTISEALSYVPGVTSQAASFGRVSDNVSIRGFDASGASGSFLRDGLKIGSGVYDSTTEPYGLERLEIIKGAPSILYGQLGPGGVINAISKKPLSTPFHEVNLGFGSYGRKELSADLSGPLTPDGTWSYRLTGLGRISDTFVRYTPDDRGYIAPALTWSPSADTTLTLLGYYQQTETRFPTPLPAVGTVVPLRNGLRIPKETFLGEPNFDKFSTRAGAIGYLFEHSFTDSLKLRQGLRYYQADTRWDYLLLNSVQANNQVINRAVSSRDESARGFTVDTSLEAKFDTAFVRHTLLAGIDYYKNELTSHRFTGTAGPPLNVFFPIYGANVVPGRNDNGSRGTSDQLGLYLQDQIKIADRLVVVVGGRLDWAEQSTRVFRTGVHTEQSDRAATGRVGVVYLHESGLAPYASYSQSFAPALGTDRLGNTFVPTTGEQVEAGLRYELPGGKTLVSGAFFNIKQQNVLTPDPVNTTFSVQQGEVRAQGAEFELRSEFGALTLLASYTYNDYRILKSNNRADIGQRPAFVPLNSASGLAIYDLSGLGLPGLKIGGGVRYVGSSNIPGLTFDNPDYVVFDALAVQDLGRIAPQLTGFEARFNARNMFDKGYTVCVAANGCRYGEPRTVLGTLSYRW